MARYGFRVYSVQAWRGSKHKGVEPEQVNVGSDTASHIADVLNLLSLEGALFIPIRQRRPDPTAAEPRPLTLSILDVVERPGFIGLVLQSGQVGAHPRAINEKSEIIPLSDWAAESEFRLGFYFSKAESSDPRFLITTEVIGNHDPVALLLRCVRARSIIEQRALEETEKAWREQNGRRPAGQKPTFWHVSFDKRQAADSAYLQAIITEAKSATAKFWDTVSSSRGPGHEVVRKVLRVRLDVHEEGLGLAGRFAQMWTTRQRADEPVPMSEAVSALGAEMADIGLLVEHEIDDYEATSVEVVGKEARATFAADNIREVFTYPVKKDLRPHTATLWDRINQRLPLIALEEGIELELMDPVEVEQWLVDSTFDRSSMA
ncbi:hypothetical protein [Nocardioides ferulae]|uniref:hypothetical protein n=1 Tax=Nocardioides ferulae TaxID=2340821 RepID=UPI000F862A37|nr:hypothetical protein [Nocardioides ferulae]